MMKITLLLVLFCGFAVFIHYLHNIHLQVFKKESYFFTFLSPGTVLHDKLTLKMIGHNPD